MMRLLALTIITCIIYIAFGCASIKVDYDYDSDADFSSFKSFIFYDKPIEGDALSKNPLIKKRVLEAVKAGLKDKGYNLSDSDESDFVVVAQAATKERVQVTNYGGYGGYRYGWGRYGHTDVNYYEEGNLIIDIIDAERKELAWRGVAKGTMKEYSSAEKMQEGFNQIIAKMLKNFPPPKDK